MSSPLAGEAIWVRCIVPQAAASGWGPWYINPRMPKRNFSKSLGTWNITSLVGKESELVCEFERYQLGIGGLTSMHRRGSGTNLLEKGWILFCSGVSQGER